MIRNRGFERYGALYAPWLLANFFSTEPVTSYLIAWSGSFLIFYLTLSGWITPLPDDRSFSAQLMRPLIIIQIIFAGFMSCTTIFYFLDGLSYDRFEATTALTSPDRLVNTAQVQRYYSLGHAALVTGILSFMKYPVTKVFYFKKDALSSLLLKIALISFPVSLAFLKTPGLSQFYYQLSSLSFIAGTLALAFAIPEKQPVNTLICSCLYLFNLYQAFLSGFKEPIIISILVLGIFLYPFYKKLILVTFLPLLLTAFIFLPSYVSNFRQNAWSEDVDAEESSKLALDAAINSDPEKSNWDFFVYRLSEIDMFITFAQSTPAHVDYYDFQLLEQSFIAIVPRALWSTKPVTEELIMERVYNAGVANRLSNVSAKPAFIVDAYLSYGQVGIWIALFAYGAIAQLISIQAEKLFGGYILGTALIFSGLFQVFWRGLSFEFLINSVFWSYITMLIIQKILLNTNFLKRV